ncbi:hypothetical protein C0995_009012, partial [Termitomyces sp. Mi166
EGRARLVLVLKYALVKYALFIDLGGHLHQRIEQPPAYWPSSSNNDTLLVVEDLEIKYATGLSAVLQNVSFISKAGERVGFLG